MKVLRSLCNAAGIAALTLAVAFPLAARANDDDIKGKPHGTEMHAQWARSQLEREANWLEIKASQQPAWDAYVAAHIDLMNTFENAKPLARDADASAATRQHAERAEAIAQSLAKVADATEKLQSVLDENQRKVLNRIERMHERFHREHLEMRDPGHERMPEHRKLPPTTDGSAKPAKPSSQPGAANN